MPVSFKELVEVFQFVSLGAIYENAAFLCRQSGKLYVHSEVVDEEELPDDIEDDEKYIQLPHKLQLDLGKPLVFAFTRQFLPDDYDEVRGIFSRKGGYARFKGMLQRKGALTQWYDFEAKAEEEALRDWCTLHSIELIE